MKQVNFCEISLIDDINKYDSQYLKCINEQNSSSSLNFKSLIFNVENCNYNFQIRMFIQENDNDISIEVLFENICKNIDVDDYSMDLIILELSQYVKIVEKEIRKVSSIKDKLNKYKGEINLDSMFIYKSECNSVTELYNIRDRVNQLYIKLKPIKLEYNNYINELFVFGSNGFKVANSLNDLGLASFRRTRSGYLINFLDEIASNSNVFISEFSKELSQIGIPTLAIPIDILDRSW